MGAFASLDEVAPASSELDEHEAGTTAPAEPPTALPALPLLAVVPALPRLTVVPAFPPLAVASVLRRVPVSRPPQPSAAANVKAKMKERAISVETATGVPAQSHEIRRNPDRHLAQAVPLACLRRREHLGDLAERSGSGFRRYFAAELGV
jgi:hypothetical protein